MQSLADEVGEECDRPRRRAFRAPLGGPDGGEGRQHDEEGLWLVVRGNARAAGRPFRILNRIRKPVLNVPGCSHRSSGPGTSRVALASVARGLICLRFERGAPTPRVPWPVDQSLSHEPALSGHFEPGARARGRAGLIADCRARAYSPEMGRADAIDITFDFRADTPPGQDPDALSPTLRRYHQLLWSKPLPSGESFELDVTNPHSYLHHLSDLGEFFLSSDSVIPTLSRELRLAHIIDQIPEVEREAFHHIVYTIGGMMVFPGNRIGRKMTINGARGFHPRIKDRFDLTLECIRRHYLCDPSPLSGTLARYADFFGLFDDFAGYVDFFYLQDLVNEATLTVKFFMPFEDFTASPLPRNLDEYYVYRQRAIEFIEWRNRRLGASSARGR